MTEAAMRLCVGHSRDKVARRAARQAARAARLKSRHPVIALVFATADYDEDALAAGLSESLGPVPWAGCSAIAVFQGVELLSRGVVVGIVDSTQVRASVGMARGVAANAAQTGRDAVARALDGLPITPASRRRIIILLPDTVAGNAAAALRGALGEGGNGVVWAGGGAGDVTGTRRLVQFAEGAAYTDSVVAVAIDLPTRAGTGVAHGWRPFGSPAMVTRAKGRSVQELEYRPAFDVYRETAALRGTELATSDFAGYARLHPLGIPQADENYLVRDPIAVDEGQLRCVAEVPEGVLIRTMRARPDDIVHAAGLAAARAREAVATPLAGALVFDCISRHMILGADFDRELQEIGRALGNVPLFGCLSFGEIAAFGREVPQFHNKTTVVVALPE